MFIQQVDIVAFKSIRRLSFRPEKSNLANHLSSNGQLSGDSLDAIRFVLDPDYDGIVDLQNVVAIADLRPQCFVRLVIAFAGSGPIPAILINHNPLAGRQLTVTRYLHLRNPIALDTRTAPDQRISLRTFHLRLYGGRPARALIAGPHQFHLLPAAPQTDADDSADSAPTPPIHRATLDAYRQCHDQLTAAAHELAATETLAVQRRILQCLRDRRASAEWRLRLEQCELAVDGASLAELSAALQLSRQAANSQQLRCNAFEATRHQLQSGLLATCTEIAELLATVRPPPEPQDARLQVKGLRLQLQRVDVEARLVRADEQQQRQLGQLARLQATLIARRHPVAARAIVEQLAERIQQLLQRMRGKVPQFALIAQQIAGRLEAAKQAVAEAAREYTEQAAAIRALDRRLASVATVSVRLVDDLHRNRLLEQQRLAAGSDWWHPQMQATFAAEVLIGCAALQSLLASDSRLGAQFVGYVMDFVVWREGQRQMAAKVQTPLRHVLLAAVFRRRSALLECQQRLQHGQLRGWSLEAEGSPPPLPAMGVDARFGAVRPLREFLQPEQLEQCSVAGALVDEWLLLMDEEAYGGAAEAARVFRRSVIGANSGRSAIYGGAATWEEWPIIGEDGREEEEEDGELNVFDVWRPIANRRAQYEERHRLEGLLRAGCEKLRVVVGDYGREIGRLQELRCHKWSLELDLNHIEENAFIFERKFERVQQLIAIEQITLHSHQLALARLDANSPPSAAAVAEVASLCADVARLQPAVLQSSAQQATLVRQIHAHFRTISNCVFEALRSSNQFASSPQWLPTIIDSLSATRTQIEADWQRLAASPATIGGATGRRQLTAANDECAALRRRLGQYSEAKQLTNRLLKLRTEELALRSGPDLWAEFDDWSPAAIAERLRELQHSVAADEQLGRSRRRLDWLRRSLAEVLALTENAAGIRQAIALVAEAKRQQQMGEQVLRMAELLPLLDVGGGGLSVELVAVSAETEQEQSEDVVDRPMRVVLLDANRQQVHLPPRKMRVLQLAWQLACCGSGPAGVVLLLGAELLRKFSASETVLIMHLLQTRSDDLLGGVQWFCGCDAGALRSLAGVLQMADSG